MMNCCADAWIYENRKSQKQMVYCVIRKTDKQQRRRRRSVGGWTRFEGQSSTGLSIPQ